MSQKPSGDGIAVWEEWRPSMSTDVHGSMEKTPTPAHSLTEWILYFFFFFYDSVFASVLPILFIVSTDVQLRLVRLTDHGLESSSGRNCLPCFCTLSLRMELGLYCWM